MKRFQPHTLGFSDADIADVEKMIIKMRQQ